jgi:hypothetical protein
MFNCHILLLFALTTSYVLANCGPGQRWTGTNCIDCSPGSYQNATSHLFSNCIDCPGGTYGSESGLQTSNCSGICIAGKYSTSGLASCADCTYGKYSTPASTSCIKCPAGTYVSSPGSPSCSSCLAGSFSTIGSQFCTLCPAGTYSINGSTSCTNCPAGTYSTQGSAFCFKCPGGTFGLSLPDVITGLTTASCSGICPAGTFSLSGSTFCTNCPSGQISPSGSNSSSACVTPPTCPLGKYATKYTCIDCPVGSFQNSSSFTGTSCTSCPLGITTSGLGSSSVSACSICAPGYAGFVTNSGTYNAAGCIICSAGSYSSADSSSCTSCPIGISTINPTNNQILEKLERGSTSVLSCRVCAPGYEGNIINEGTINATGCTPCGLGRYSDERWIASNTGFNGGCLKCPPGTYGNSVGLSSETCSGSLSCNAGRYALSGATSNDTSSLSVCALCQTGSMSIAGSTSQSQCICPAGTYSYSSSPSCMDCMYDWTSLPGSSFCSIIRTSCSTGQYLADGVCVSCPQGSYQSLSSFTGSSCTKCSAGTYGSAAPSGSGSTSPSACSNVCTYGTYSLTGANSCSIATRCGAGKRAIHAATSDIGACMDCEPGTYQSSTSHFLPTCLSCPAGTWGSTSGLTSSTCSGTLSCAPGRYALSRATSNDINNVTTCALCPAGTFSSFSGSLFCSSCPSGTSSIPGSSLCVACNATTYSYSGGTCTSCPPGSTILSSTYGCAPSTSPIDTSFYLSGTNIEGVRAFSSVTSSFTTDVFGTQNGAIYAVSSSLIVNGLDAPTTLPSGGNVPWSISSWIKCSPVYSEFSLLQWGSNNNDYLFRLNRAASLVLVTKSDYTFTPTLSSSQGISGGSNTNGAVVTDEKGTIYFLSYNSGSLQTSSVYDQIERSTYYVNVLGSYSGSPTPVLTFIKSSPPYSTSTTITSSSTFNNPRGIAVDSIGNVYVADTMNHEIKKIYPDGTIITIATGFNYPYSVAVNANGEVYVADTFNGVIKKILTNWTVITLFSSRHPTAIAIDNFSNIYVAEEPLGGFQLRKFNLNTGASSFLYGPMDSTNGGFLPSGNTIAVDPFGYIYFGARVRSKVLTVPGNDIIPSILKINPDGMFNSTILSTELFSSSSQFYSFAVLQSGQIIINYAISYGGPPSLGSLRLVHNRIHIPVCDSTWHHVTLTYDPNNSIQTAYVDGKMISTRSLWAPIILPSPSSSLLQIQGGYNSYYPVPFSDLRIYNRTISAIEAQALSEPSPNTFFDSKLETKQSSGNGSYWFFCALGYSGPLAIYSKNFLDNSFSWSSSPSCFKCPAGTMASLGATSCTVCPPGTYSLSGASMCTNCPINTFNSKVGAVNHTQCRLCPEGTISQSGSATCEKVLQTIEPLSDPSSCQLKLFPSSDLSGNRLSELSTATETDCSRACCKNSTCLGYTFFRTLQSCTLLSNISYVIPSSFISGGVRDSALWL